MENYIFSIKTISDFIKNIPDISNCKDISKNKEELEVVFNDEKFSFYTWAPKFSSDNELEDSITPFPFSDLHKYLMQTNGFSKILPNIKSDSVDTLYFCIEANIGVDYTFNGPLYSSSDLNIVNAKGSGELADKYNMLDRLWITIKDGKLYSVCNLMFEYKDEKVNVNGIEYKNVDLFMKQFLEDYFKLCYILLSYV